MEMYVAIAAVIVSAVGLLITAGDKVFGGGTALAAKFHKLDKDVANDIAALRRELHEKVDNFESAATVSFDGIKSSVHAMQLATLEFRAKVAEELHSYIRKDDYNAGIADIKQSVQEGFRRVDSHLGQLQDLIIYVNPDVPTRQHKA